MWATCLIYNMVKGHTNATKEAARKLTFCLQVKLTMTSFGYLVISSSVHYLVSNTHREASPLWQVQSNAVVLNFTQLCLQHGGPTACHAHCNRQNNWPCNRHSKCTRSKGELECGPCGHAHYRAEHQRVAMTLPIAIQMLRKLRWAGKSNHEHASRHF